MLNEIYLLILLLALSAFFSSSETALISLSRIKLRSMIKKNVKGSNTIKKLKDNPHRLLSTILIGNNLVNVGAAAVATSLAFELLRNYAVAISTGVMTLVVLIFGEVIPKSFATQHDKKVSLLVAKPILVLGYVLCPVNILLEKITRVFIKKSKKTHLTEEELKAAVELGEEAGFIQDVEKRLLKNVFKFDEINVSEIMTPRPDIFSIEINRPLKKVLPKIIKANYTRIPVYEKNLNHIVGILNMKDLVPFIKSKDIPINKIMYKPFFVPENKKVDSMLKQFLKRKEHMAIVVNEHGLVSGLITLENVIEEIVGEIKDETDRVNPHIVKISKNTWDILGKSDIEEVNEKLKSDFKEAKDYDTISGLVLDKLGRIPKQGETINLDTYSIEVTELDRHRIVKVRIRKK
jgi:CBS domain containing-hemolysin-like protein